MRKIALAVAGLAALTATPALADTATTTMTVRVAVDNACQVGATTMNFGSPTSIGTADIYGSSTVSVLCTIGADYNVSMGFGQGATGSGPTLLRHMTGVDDTSKAVPYEIYSDDTYSTAWGDTIGTDTVSLTSAPADYTYFTAYGRIPADAEPVPAQVYRDRVTVTVTF